MMKIIRQNNGFTLLETVIAMGVLAVGLMTYVGLHLSATRGSANGISITGKSSWAAERIERLMLLSYDDLVAMDDGDGTDQDPLENGQDNDGGNFGLNDATAGTADGSATSPDGTYTIFWNIAANHPLTNMVTVNVIVTSRKQGAQQKDVEFQYIKSTM